WRLPASPWTASCLPTSICRYGAPPTCTPAAPWWMLPMRCTRRCAGALLLRPAPWTSRWSAWTCWCQPSTNPITSSSRPMSDRGWPIMNPSRQRSVSSICCSHSASPANRQDGGSMQFSHGPDMQYLRQVLLEMLAIPCPTGFTDGIVRYVAEHLDALGVPYELTRRGTIRATLKGRQGSPDRAIASHLDTVGAMVSHIKDNGRLTLAPIGCWSSRFAEGSRVSVFTEQGCFRGSVLPLMASGHAFNTEVDTLPVSWDTIELRLD